ncbi:MULTISPECIES: BlaI/MecI/CopY family transcriptional regulator [unclassified Streptomyces]|uniref:BlaI/MecI/CopY family transcriptional regulator n=1 Tax=unclassified Streptomyces TaxID=2593676 RepID=UPI0029671391|nr:BlaI/MecI/CopY family transcriptional regulator [Streptomyces sp. SJL17-1]
MISRQSGPAADGRSRRGPGELEAGVLAALGSAPGPVAAGWVREQVDPGLAYTTVMTALARLRVKRAVVRRHDGRCYVWSAVLDPAGLAAWRMHRVLDGGLDRRAVLSEFVAGLSSDEGRALRNLLDSVVPREGDPAAVDGGETEGDGPVAGQYDEPPPRRQAGRTGGRPRA